MKKAILAALAIMTATGCARPATVASHTASARTDQTETARNVAPAQSYATAVRTGVAYDICRSETIESCAMADAAAGPPTRVYTDPATCKGERSCLVRVCEDYADMVGTQLHETPDSDGGVLCVMAWSEDCSFYPEIDNKARGIGGERLCVVEAY